MWCSGNFATVVAVGACGWFQMGDATCTYVSFLVAWLRCPVRSKARLPVEKPMWTRPNYSVVFNCCGKAQAYSNLASFSGLVAATISRTSREKTAKSMTLKTHKERTIGVAWTNRALQSVHIPLISSNKFNPNSLDGMYHGIKNEHFCHYSTKLPSIFENCN